MPPKTTFEEGEKVLCLHGQLLYEAKCVEVDVKDKLTRYYIHYKGWKKGWNEWVPEIRLIKHNEAGLQKQKELKDAHGAGRRAVTKASKGECKSEEKEEKEKTEKEEKGKKGSRSSQAVSKKQKKATPAASLRSRLSASAATSRRTSAASSSARDPKRRWTRANAPKVETEEMFVSHTDVKVKMPEELKPWLVDDWDLITRQKMLVNLPCRNTVDNILDDYVKIKTAENGVNKDAVIVAMAGMKDYFNVMLGSQLLYKFERPQYSEIMAGNPGKSMSSLYGATHLLRLFVRLGQMLDFTPMDENCVEILLTHVHDFLRYMRRNSASLFSHADYIIALPEYHRKVI